MGKGHDFFRRIGELSDSDTPALPGIPIVEVTGTDRVLIENHCGVKEYGHEKIVVNVKYGTVCICGGRLELRRMTREQLVICGRIDGLMLHRRR